MDSRTPKELQQQGFSLVVLMVPGEQDLTRTQVPCKSGIPGVAGLSLRPRAKRVFDPDLLNGQGNAKLPARGTARIGPGPGVRL